MPMTLLGSFASRNKVVLRRTLYLAAGSAAVMATPHLLDRVPPPGERQQALQGVLDRMQVCGCLHVIRPRCTRLSQPHFSNAVTTNV